MLADLPEDIRAELTEERFITRQHYSRSTYALGCRGPLCQKAERDRGRKRNKRRGGENYRPQPGWRVDDPKGIDEIIKWHFQDLAERRATLAEKAS